MTQVLVVDDVPAMAEQYAYDLRRVGRYDTIVAAGGDEALDVLAREAIDCVVLDLEMPGTDGFEVLRRLQQRGIETPVIVYTGTGSYDRCVQAVRLGAYGFVDKEEPIERVVQEIENAVSRGRMVKELRSLRSRVDGETSLIGDSAPMLALREAIARVAPIPSSVLIVGESGSGKELVARELHRLGPGAKTPLVAVNSAALPEQLVESELFGHERGAFTGADRLRRGAFESAGNGTLFLDEVGELPVPAQAKLLRVLEDRQVMRLGGSRAVQVMARVVAATNRDLEHEVEAGLSPAQPIEGVRDLGFDGGLGSRAADPYLDVVQRRLPARAGRSVDVDRARARLAVDAQRSRPGNHAQSPHAGRVETLVTARLVGTVVRPGLGGQPQRPRQEQNGRGIPHGTPLFFYFFLRWPIRPGSGNVARCRLGRA